MQPHPRVSPPSLAGRPAEEGEILGGGHPPTTTRLVTYGWGTTLENVIAYKVCNALNGPHSYAITL